MNPAAVLEWAAGVAAWGGTPWVLLALALATFASDDLACVAGGLLVAAGRLDFWAATLACFVGIVAGDLILVAAGRGLGRTAFATLAPTRAGVGDGAGAGGGVVRAAWRAGDFYQSLRARHAFAAVSGGGGAARAVGLADPLVCGGGGGVGSAGGGIELEFGRGGGGGSG